MRALFWILAAGAALTAPAAEFSARLNTRLTTYDSAAGSEFSATVTEAARKGDRILIPEGATLFGRVVSVRSVGIGFRRERAEMALEVHSCEVPGGTPLSCTAVVTGIDNARESTTSNGRIRGVLAAGGPSGLARGFWRMPSQAVLHRPFTRLIGIGTGGFAPAFSLGLMGVRWAVLRFPEPEIELPTGTELLLNLTSRSDGAPEFQAETVRFACARNYSGLPRDLQRPNGKPTDDIVNVLFAGTREQLTTAFAAAGWVAADPLNRRTFVRMYHAWTSMKGYPTAPVSLLTYDGREPDLVFQKSFNTVSRRHHVRIWRVPGRDMWVGAATHDVGISF
ncbi:MAG: LssY C-terminal domain-containing protein, partial [Bryobacteraceae bacterium]|nr:LssY C-terminal domain-containing protein [Bryobacteraceae bacterium]